MPTEVVAICTKFTSKQQNFKTKNFKKVTEVSSDDSYIEGQLVDTKQVLLAVQYPNIPNFKT